MKTCPKCSFRNTNDSPTCIWCNELLVNVAAIHSNDPESGEYAAQERQQARDRTLRRQLLSAAACYSLVITFTAAVPGLVLKPSVLALYFGSAALVALAVSRRLVGPVLAPLLQGLLSVLLVVSFGPTQPFIFVTLFSHIVIPILFCHWAELISFAHR